MSCRHLLLAFLALASSSCAVLHHVSVGNVAGVDKGKKFEIYMSELGINAQAIGDAMSRQSKNGAYSRSAEYLGYFQWGPRTGNVVYNVSAYEGLLDALRGKCPNGRITGLTSVREMRNYHFASGEIVKVIGYCVG